MNIHFYSAWPRSSCVAVSVTPHLPLAAHPKLPSQVAEATFAMILRWGSLGRAPWAWVLQVRPPGAKRASISRVPCRECGLCKHGACEPAWYVLVSYISRRSQSSQHRNRRPVNVFTPHRTRRQKLCLGWFCGAERRQKVVRRDRVRGAGAGCIGGASCDVVFTSGMRARHSQRLANSPKFCIPK